MMSSAFAFAELSSKVTNNTSVVLLIEWKGKRLLFVGDAEWDTKFKEGKSNGAWNVMWHERKGTAEQPHRLPEDRPSRQRERDAVERSGGRDR